MSILFLFDVSLHHSKHVHLHQFLLWIYEQQNTNQLQRVNHQFYTFFSYFLLQIFSLFWLLCLFLYELIDFVWGSKIFSEFTCFYYTLNHCNELSYKHSSHHQSTDSISFVFFNLIFYFAIIFNFFVVGEWHKFWISKTFL